MLRGIFLFTLNCWEHCLKALLVLFVSEPAEPNGQSVPTSAVRGECVREMLLHGPLLSREVDTAKSVSSRSNFTSTPTGATPFPTLIPLAPIPLARWQLLSGHSLYPCLSTAGTGDYQDPEKREGLERWRDTESLTCACLVSGGGGH